MSSTKRIGLEYLEVNQSQKETTVNEAFNKLDLFAGLTIESVISAPPSSPTEGAAFLVGESATDAFLGKEKQIAHYLNAGWEFYAPFDGLKLYCLADGSNYRYLSGAWQTLSEPTIQVVDALPATPVAGVIYFVKEATTLSA